MKPKIIFPWILVLASVASAGFFYAENKKAQAELVELRAQQSELIKLRAEVTELKHLQYAEAEIERLTKENVEVHKLRNEVRQLREESRVLTTQLQSQPSQQSQITRSEPSDQELLQELERLRAENRELRLTAARTLEASATTEENLARYATDCINNLRQLDGAIQQWALANSKTQGDIPEYEALLAYMPTPPTCPQGGSYTVSGVGKKPSCNMTDHKLPE